jgi:hypothetical protein
MRTLFKVLTPAFFLFVSCVSFGALSSQLSATGEFAQIKSVYPECSSQFLIIENLVRQYSETVLSQGLPAGRFLHNTIRSYLLNTEASNPKCFEAVSADYLRMSLNLLEFGDPQVDHRKSRLSSELFSSGRLTFLTPMARTKSNLCALNKKKWFHYSVVGVYSCTKSVLKIDVTKGPLDIAAIFNHEATHLAFDLTDPKYVFLQNTLDHAVADEFFAILYEAFLQRTFHHNFLHSGRLGFFRHDLTRFNVGGPVDQLVALIRPRNYADFVQEISASLQNVQQESVIASAKDKRVVKIVAELMARIEKSYINGKQVNTKAPPFSLFNVANSLDMVGELTLEGLSNDQSYSDTLLLWNKPTAYCENFQTAVKEGRLKLYTGTEQNGNDGGRPSEGNIGGRPDQDESGKCEDSNGKNGNDGGRPCIDMRP